MPTNFRFSLVASAIQPSGAWAQSLDCPQEQSAATAALESCRTIDLPTPSGKFTGYQISLTKITQAGFRDVGREKLGTVELPLAR